MKFKIIQENHDDRGIFYAMANEKVGGILTYIWGDDKNMIVDSTKITKGFENEGISELLIEAAEDCAREKNCKVVPMSSYVSEAFKISEGNKKTI
jgi:predicted GNAT family acetyltransferase